MFNLHEIFLHNFRAYSGDHRFEFPQGSGLYFLTGAKNGSLGSTGNGKSSFLDAIVWALYGRTTRGLKANEVITWGANTCQVSLELTVGPDKFTIKRTQKPNTLFVDDKPVDQQELENLLRLNYESFVYSVINPQFGDSFLALSPSAKLTLFSEIMGLNFWLEKSEETAKAALQLASQAEALQRAISSNEGQIKVTLEDIEGFGKAGACFLSKQQVDISIKKKELTRAASAAVTLDDKMSEIVAENKARIKKLESLRAVELDNINKYARERATFLGKAAALKEQLAECKKLNGKCPTCQQTIDATQLSYRVRKLEIEIESIGYSVSACEDDILIEKKHLIQTNLKIDTLVDEVNATRDKQAEAKVLQGKVSRLEDELQAIKAKTNPYTDLINHKKEKLKHLELALAVDSRNKDRLDAEHAAISFWIKGFKRIRLFIIEEAFRTLELEVNNSLAQLGMQDWQLTFDVERENKSGGITKGFVVFVKSPVNNEPVRWENWSGGETQRLQLAGDLGLANLIITRAGLTSKFEAYDEPSTHLSPEGMMDLANLLHERAVAEDKQIWIVDHAAITNFGDFQGVITARKGKDGSASITYEGAR